MIKSSNNKKLVSNKLSLNILFTIAITACVTGCSTWNKLDRTEKGAVIGTGSGAVLGGAVGGTGGAVLGGVGGGVVGGVIGHEQDEDRKKKY